jgi:hypothetical protein
MLTLDGHQTMLNTGLQGGEGVPFYCIVFCSIAEYKNWEWGIGEKNRWV